MAWFKKKSDPISERARDLSKQISDLEAQIRELSAQEGGQSRPPSPSPTPQSAPEPSAPRNQRGSPPTKPRLRSTAFPQGHASAPAPTQEATASQREPLFEEVSRNPFKAPSEKGSTDPKDLGVRRSDFVAIWRRFKNHWRGPATSNPKLVNYLAAGSIQGLRPLRYEKRVARNRFILLLVCLILVLWGIIAIIMRN